MTVDTSAFCRLVAAFLATRASASTREAYRRDLTHLASALEVGEGGIPSDEAIRDAFGIEDDPDVRALLEDLVNLGPEWWRRWRDDLDGQPGHAPAPGRCRARLLPVVVARVRSRESGQ